MSATGSLGPAAVSPASAVGGLIIVVRQNADAGTRPQPPQMMAGDSAKFPERPASG